MIKLIEEEDEESKLTLYAYHGDPEYSNGATITNPDDTVKVHGKNRGRRQKTRT